ncbi:MAG: hypothetical protein DI537_10630 [Stutzerimonas stutzeri]|nr:MAG: hypothetical protein DI537_10630 [Stutzerimonas stutzeri]
MAFKLDFTKIRPRSAEEIEAAYQAERAAARVADAQKREELSKKTLTLTITEVYASRTATGGRKIQIWGTQSDGRPARASVFIDDCYDREIADAMVRDLTENLGTRLMRGYWKSHNNDEGKTFWTFRAQKIQTLGEPINIAFAA